MSISTRKRAELRGQAHHLEPAVQVGHQGITQALLQSLDDALRTHELVKVQLARQAPMHVRDAARDLAAATGAEVVQVIGRTATLWREKVGEAAEG